MIEWLVEAALRSLLVAGVLLLGITVFRVRDPHRQKTLWTTLLLGALAMPCLSHWMLIPPLAPLSFADSAGVLDNFRTARAPIEALVAIYVLYMGVSSILLLRMLSGIYRMLRIRSRAAPIREAWTRSLDVRIASELSSPATFGTTILLPLAYSSWSSDKRTIILRHEETHVQHRDSHTQWLASLHICLFWFSPLPWWLRRRLAQLAEYTSDDAVLRLSVSGADYAAVLLEEAEARPAHSMLVSIAGRDLERRVDRVLQANPPAKSPSQGRHALVALSVIPLIVLASVSVGDPRQSDLFRDAPFIVSGPSLDELERYYPPTAEHSGAAGLVQLRVTLDAAGHAMGTRILSETPAGMGFGSAATELAHHFKYANPTAQHSSITYRVKFELRKPSQQR